MTPQAPHKRKASLWATLSAVLWAFLGVRRKSDYQQDIERLNPLHLMAVGIVMALLFVLGLIFLVNWVVTQG
jgi:amino acid transporter